MGTIDDRLAELGMDIPTPAAPVANYVGWVRTGNLVFTAGQVPLKDGEFMYQGIVGDINGASDMMVAVFGDKGKHARSAVGAGSLPINLSVEIEAVVEIE